MKTHDMAIVGIGVIVLIGFLLFVVAYVSASFCPDGYSAVKNIWGWPVCIKTAP